MNKKDVEKVAGILNQVKYILGENGKEFLADIARQIVAALRDEPQVDEEGLLTDESIEKAIGIPLPKHSEGYMESLGVSVTLSQLRMVSKSQFSADNARWQRKVEALFYEIEAYFPWIKQGVNTEPWEAIKKSRIGGGE